MNQVAPAENGFLESREADGDQGVSLDERLECEDVSLFDDPPTLDKLNRIVDQLGNWKDSIKIEESLTSNVAHVEGNDGSLSLRRDVQRGGEREHRAHSLEQDKRSDSEDDQRH